jgi:hypothetical protein
MCSSQPQKLQVFFYNKIDIFQFVNFCYLFLWSDFCKTKKQEIT